MINKLAKLKFLPNNFEIIEEGDHVICAISKKKIRLLIFPSVVSPNPLIYISYNHSF